MKTTTTYAVQTRLQGRAWGVVSLHRTSKEAAKAAAKFLGLGYTAQVVAL